MRHAGHRVADVQTAKIQLVPDAKNGQSRVWQITLHLDVGTVTIPGVFRIASAAEEAARDHLRTLRYRVVGTSIQPEKIVLEVQRISR